jgi:MerR family transcriptional regulator, light-induced transcriptional regulator
MKKGPSTQIKELRKKKGYTQKELAQLLGIGQTTVANYEQGTRIPDAEKLQRMADLFEVTLDYLVGREENESSAPSKTKRSIKSEESTDLIYKVYIEYLLNGHREAARVLISSLYEEGINIEVIYFNILEKALKEVGTLWETGVIDVWKEHFISETTLDIMREIKIKEKKGKCKAHSFLALTAGPELHNIGLKMLTDMLEIEGWHVTYLGSNVPVQSLINAIEAEKPDVLAISVTIPHHIEASKNMITAIRNYFSRKSPKIIIGGSAFLTPGNVCEETGADYYGNKVEDIKKIFEYDVVV